MRLSSVRYDDYFLPFVFEEFRANCSSSLAIIKTLPLSGGGEKKEEKCKKERSGVASASSIVDLTRCGLFESYRIRACNEIYSSVRYGSGDTIGTRIDSHWGFE